jgi:isopropylmalate/homocitrate/citramalate synthase
MSMKKIKRKQYELQDVKKPQLFREIFPYSTPPLVLFDGASVPMNLPKDFWITDTTFRDGQQARPPYTIEQVIAIFKFMHRLGGPKGVIRQSEFFIYNERDQEAVHRCRELGYRFPEVTGWIRANKSDFALVTKMKLKETGILTSASDYHIFLKLKKTRKEAMESYLDIVCSALEANIIPRCHLEDITRADFYGFVIPFVQALMKLSAQSNMPIKIRACDTMGYGVPFPEATLPRSIPKLIHGLIHDGGVPPQHLEWHGHNDFHKAAINGMNAWMYGCAALNATIFGFGERTGNPSLEGAIFDFIALKGSMHGIDTAVITDMADYFTEKVKYKIPANYPFVGKNFNTTSAGIHADGMLKNPEIYNIFETETLLKRPMGISVTDKSGVAGIVYWINSNYKLAGDKQIPKNHPGIAMIYGWIVAQYNKGRTSVISDDEMFSLVAQFVPELKRAD